MTGDGPRQPAYEILPLNVDFSSLSPDLLRSKRPVHAGVKESTSLKVVIFQLLFLSSVKMVADRHRLAAYHNKHW